MSDPFITVAELSDLTGRDMSTQTGGTIAVEAACDIVRTLSEQSFNRGTTTVTLDGTGTDTLLLPQLPAGTASTVVVNGGTLTATDYTVTEQGQLVRTNGTAIWSTWSQTGYPCAYWPKGRQNVSVTYDHGYDDPPEDVRMVALSIASRLAIQGVAKSETVGDDSITYAVNSTDLTNGEQAILRKYKQAQ